MRGPATNTSWSTGWTISLPSICIWDNAQPMAPGVRSIPKTYQLKPLQVPYYGKSNGLPGKSWWITNNIIILYINNYIYIYIWSQLWIAWFVSWLYQGWSATSYVCRQNPLCQPSNLPILEQVIFRFGDAWRIETVFSGGWSKNDWGDTNPPGEIHNVSLSQQNISSDLLNISEYQPYISHISAIYQPYISHIIFISYLYHFYLAVALLTQCNDHLPSTPFAGWAETAAAPLRHSARRHRPSPRRPAAHGRIRKIVICKIPWYFLEIHIFHQETCGFSQQSERNHWNHYVNLYNYPLVN